MLRLASNRSGGIHRPSAGHEQQFRGLQQSFDRVLGANRHQPKGDRLADELALHRDQHRHGVVVGNVRGRRPPTPGTSAEGRWEGKVDGSRT